MKTILRITNDLLGDDLMNDYLVKYIEKDIFEIFDNKNIIQHFQNMKLQRILL